MSANPLATPMCPPDAPLLGRLEGLAFPAAVAAANLQLLPRLTALLALSLAGSDTAAQTDPSGVAPPPDHEWEQLLGTAARLRSLVYLSIST